MPVFAVLSLAACVEDYSSVETSGTDSGSGTLVVNMVKEADHTKTETSYVSVLEEEKAEHKVEIFVFDRSTDRLAASRTVSSVLEKCTFSMPVGPKSVYVVVNGPDMRKVRNLGQFNQVLDDLSGTSLSDDGLVMVGYADCTVTPGAVARPLVVVKRLVARVVVQKISCSIPSQYDKMRVDCVFLGNAYSKQTLSGTVSEMCNKDGYAGAKENPIGKNGVKGACEEYFFRNVNSEITVGSSSLSKHHLYCQPNSTDTHTCLYLLVTIGDTQYYYRVPLHNKLRANATCSVEIDIINLGASLPPDNDIQKGEIIADVKIDGWAAGDDYSVLF